jgi:hypothetical protein
MSTAGSFLDGKVAGCEIDHLLPTSSEVKKIWIIHSPLRLHGIVLNQLNTGTTFVYLNTELARTSDEQRTAVCNAACLIRNTFRLCDIVLELYQPSDRPLSAKLVPTFAD